MVSGIDGIDDLETIIVRIVCIEHGLDKVIYLSDRGFHKQTVESVLCCSSCSIDFTEHDEQRLSLKDILGL